jgi:hypothetical protein
MSDLKAAILDAKYIDMIALADFVVRDTGLPDVDSEGNLMPQAIEIAAALFRWAADAQAAEAPRETAPAMPAPDDRHPEQGEAAETAPDVPEQAEAGATQTQGGY